MKNWIAYAFIVFVSAVSCIDKPDVHDPDRLIRFSAAIDNPTKTEGDVMSYPTNKPFKVWAYTPVALIEGEVVSYSNECWMTEEEHYWPSTPQTIDFNACSPADTPVEYSQEEGVIFRGFDTSVNSDFLYALPIQEVSKPYTDSPVNIVFKSPLCEVDFFAYGTSEDKVSIWVTGIELPQTYSIGNFNSFPHVTWSELREPEDLRVFEGKTLMQGRPQQLGEVNYIIPQIIEPIVHYTYMIDGSQAAIDRVEKVDLREAPGLEVGKKREYILKISQDTIVVQRPRYK